MLRPADQTYLDDHHFDYETVSDAEGTHLILRSVPLSPGLLPDRADFLITLPPGFNDIGPDMFWCSPAIGRADGRAIPGTEAQRQFQGRVWQRWSRHISGAWRPGIDNVATYIAYVRRAVADAVEEAA